MKIEIKTQAELDALLEIAKGDEVAITGNGLRLTHVCTTRGSLRISVSIDTSWDDKYFEARENASVVARGNASVEAWENASVEARGNASVVARGNASVEAWENVAVRLNENTVAKLHGYAVAWISGDGNCSAHCLSDTARIQVVQPSPYLEREGVAQEDGKVVLFKRVSKDFKTQEGTSRETMWIPGTISEHPAWEPKRDECGAGKYHAVSRPYFGDEFRETVGDRYIAIQIAVEDLYEWPKAQYPHKIAFRRGSVLYECDKYGKKIG